MTEDFGYWQQSSNGVYNYSSIPESLILMFLKMKNSGIFMSLRTGLFLGHYQELFL